MLLAQISEKVEQAFVACGLDRSLGSVRRSDRPDLSDFQCNGALQGAKVLRRKPVEIANEVAVRLREDRDFVSVSVDGPGFINLKVADSVIYRALKAHFPDQVRSTSRQKLLVDYGGPNVAKPLHVGHLRSSIIGEAIKRIARALGHEVISDIHLGDWGTPMGMLIAYLEETYPDWVYFSPDFVAAGEVVPLPISGDDLIQLYPAAAKRFKEEPEFANRSREATAQLQAGHTGYRALWQQFVAISVRTIKADLSLLDVDFDLWLGESDADPFIAGMIKDFVARGVARESDGALVVDVAREGDKNEIPPLILQKKDGAATYATTDIATIMMRAREKVDRILYVVDQRQFLHFIQVFRSAAKGGLMNEAALEHIGFGTMNGKDGKPFKTRAGGVMRLGDLIQNSRELALKESGFDAADVDADVREMIDQVAIAAIKFGDLSNPRTSDYVFDPDQFIRFEGKTGPYVQYAAVRVRSVLEKARASEPPEEIGAFSDAAERRLALAVLTYPDALFNAFDKRLPSELCDHVYTLAREFSSFYKQCPMLREEDAAKRSVRLLLAQKTLENIEAGFACLAIPLPHRMVRAPAIVAADEGDATA